MKDERPDWTTEASRNAFIAQMKAESGPTPSTDGSTSHLYMILREGLTSLKASNPSNARAALAVAIGMEELIHGWLHDCMRSLSGDTEPEWIADARVAEELYHMIVTAGGKTNETA